MFKKSWEFSSEWITDELKIVMPREQEKRKAAFPLSHSSLFIYVMNVKTCCCCSSPFFVEYLHIFWLSIRWTNFNLQLLSCPVLSSLATRVNLLACHFSAVRYWFIGVTHCALFTTIFDLSAVWWAAAGEVGRGRHSRICLTLAEHLAAFGGAEERRKSEGGRVAT